MFMYSFGPGTGNFVKAEMFSTNFLTRLYSSNPDGNFAEAFDMVGATGLRFPGGSMTEESFSVRDPHRTADDQGRQLVPLDAFLDMANTLGVPVTITIPTRMLLGVDRDGFGNRSVDEIQIEYVRSFIANTLQDAQGILGVEGVSKLIKAFEIGNEYWGSGAMSSTEYGRIVDALAPVISKEIQIFLGSQSTEEVGVLCQMGGPFALEFAADGIYDTITSSSDPKLLSSLDLKSSDFGSDGLLTWHAKTMIANEDIIEQISLNSKKSITGLVEHIYYIDERDDLNFSSAAMRNVDKDIAAWKAAGYSDLDIGITEWNVAGDNEAQWGLKGAGVMLFMFESMIRLGVDSAFTWPLLSIRATDIAGTLKGKPVLSPSGAVLEHMAEHLIGLELIKVEEDIRDIEISTYANSLSTVIYFASRTNEPSEFTFNLQSLVANKTLVSAEVVGVDLATSDGQHVIPYGSKVAVPYYMEHDALASLRELPLSGLFSGGSLRAALNPYEVLMLVFSQPSGGGAGDDSLFGEAGNDTLNGGAGNDILMGRAGADMLIGGDGFDMSSYVSALAAVTVDLATQNLNTGDAFGDVLVAVEGVLGSGFSDDLRGDAGDNLLDGGAGRDTLTGRAGNDLLQGRSGADTLLGGLGADTLEGGAGADVLTGGDGFDHASYANATAAVRADLAKPKLNTSDAAGDIYSGIEGVLGGNFADDLRGDGLANLLDGGAGHDLLSGFSGNDTLFGGAGNDTLDGGYGADVMDGGEGYDWVSFASAVAGQVLDLANPALNTYSAKGDSFVGIEAIIGSKLRDNLSGDALDNHIDGGAGNDTLSGRAGADSLLGGLGDDRIWGGDGDDTLQGNAGRDWLTGDAGTDRIYGGDGNDTLTGGLGEDWLTGGLGADRFEFNPMAAGQDVITDYSAQQGDYLAYTATGASKSQFQVKFAAVEGVGNTTAEAIVTHKPSGLVLWIIADGAAMTQLNLQFGGTTFDLI
jgi:Ca2+-binding RTX toxin-like protein